MASATPRARPIEAARSQGRTASLLEQDRPNVFRMNVANLLPGDQIQVDVSYVEAIVPSEHLYELSFPTVVGPRYTTAAAGADGSSHSPYLHAGVPSAHTFALDATIDSPVPLRTLHCPSHRARIEFPNARQARVTIAEGDEVADRDAVIRWTVEGPTIESGMLVGESDGEEYFLLAVEPPARVQEAALVPREYVFVVDVSGSMNGFPLDTAKTLMRNLLGGLRPSDRFDILSFSGGSRLLAASPLPADAANVKRASQFMDGMTSGGGTNLLPSLERALALPRSDASRIVVVITDGFVDVERESFELVRRSLGQANLFAFGIGGSVNRFLIEGLARAGRGEPFVVTRPDEAAGTAARFQTYVDAPVLRDLRLAYHGLDVAAVEPAALPDLLAERPIVVHGRFRGEPRGTVTLTGVSAAGPFTQVIDVSRAARLNDGAALRSLWARERLIWLQDLSAAGGGDSYKDEITRLGLAHHLMTRYTSFVAVDSAVRATEKATAVQHPLPMPDGVSDSALRAGVLGVLGSQEGSAPGLAFGWSGEGMISGNQAQMGSNGRAGLFGIRGSGGPSGYGWGAGGLGGRRAHPPEVALGVAQVRGALDKEIIRRVLRRHLNELKLCYEKELVRKVLPGGGLVLRLTIGGSGMVLAAELRLSTIKDPAVEECALSAARGWEFPKPAGGGLVIVDYPLEFKLAN